MGGDNAIVRLPDTLDERTCKRVEKAARSVVTSAWVGRDSTGLFVLAPGYVVVDHGTERLVVARTNAVLEGRSDGDDWN